MTHHNHKLPKRITSVEWIPYWILGSVLGSAFRGIMTLYIIMFLGYIFFGEFTLGKGTIITGTLVFALSLIASLLGKGSLTIKDGSIGIIRIFGRKILTHIADEGDFRKIPFVRIDPLVIEFDNLVVDYSDVQTKDGVAMKGKIVVEKEAVDVFKIQDLTSTKEGADGRIKAKTLELIKEAMDNFTVEQIIQQKNGSKNLTKAFKKEAHKTACFEEPKTPCTHIHGTKDGMYKYFVDAGMNLRFLIQTHTGQNEELNKAFDNISIQEANKKSTIVKAEAEAEAFAIKKKNERKVFTDAFIEYTKDHKLSKQQAVYQANLLADYFDHETLVTLSGPKGELLEGSIERLIAIAQSISSNKPSNPKVATK